MIKSVVIGIDKTNVGRICFGLKTVGNIRVLTCDKFKRLAKSIKNSNKSTVTNRAFLRPEQ